jgi:NAD+ dependent glucose-6-phosphate dehydrogenase
MAGQKRVLITGAAGRIGSSLARGLKDRYSLRLHYNRTIPESPPVSDIVIADVSQYDQIRPAMDGIDTVIHMAADPSPTASWESVRDRNIAGTYNVYEAAREAGVRRVIFASTNHVMGMYDRDQAWPIYANQPARPDSLYGVSKAFGETLGRFYVDQYGLSVICLRIGWFLEKPRDEIGMWMWLSQRDCTQVVWRAIETERQYGVYYAISRNSRRRWDITNTIHDLGYRPEDDSEQFAAEVDGQDGT